MTSRQDAARAIAKLKRQSDKQLLLSVSRKSTKLYRQRHYVGTIHAHHKARDGRATKWKRTRGPVSTIDLGMLDTLGAALRQRPSVQSGQEILEALWPRVRNNVCRKLRICETFKPGDPGLILAIWSLLHRGQPITDRDVYLIVAVLAIRLGPEWMCHCSEREQRAH